MSGQSFKGFINENHVPLVQFGDLFVRLKGDAHDFHSTNVIFGKFFVNLALQKLSFREGDSAETPFYPQAQIFWFDMRHK